MTGGMLTDATVLFDGMGEYPMQMFVCSSTLIAPDVVLLAAHCLDEMPLTYGMGEVLEQEVVWSRLADFSDYDGQNTGVPWPEDAVVAADWVVHPSFDLTAMTVGLAENYDIALLFLEEAVLDVPHAYLPTPAESEQIVEGAMVNVVGWGQQVATSGQQAPPAGSYLYKIMGESDIADINGFEMQIGSTTEGVRKCHGDSGGPTFLDITTDTPESMRLIGVTSHAYDETDCELRGGVDTRVDHYLAWIEEEMSSRCEDGTRVWCEEIGIVQAPVESATGDVDDVEEKGFLGCSTVATSSGMLWLVPLIGVALTRRKEFAL